MSDVSKADLLIEAMKLLGPLSPDGRKAATFLLTLLGDVSVEHRPSYSQTMQALSEIEHAAKLIENRLELLDQLVLETLPAVGRLLTTLSRCLVLVWKRFRSGIWE